MRYLMHTATAAALAAIFMTLPSQAANYRHFTHPGPYDGRYADSKGYGTGPFYQGTPNDRLPIWRNGYYQGNDPDQFIRGQIMRDPTNGQKAR
jgi:hypothetical protein